jgi:hypothetical protein
MNDEIWNIDSKAPPKPRLSRSAPQFVPVCEAHFANKPLSVLEIGVFQGGLTELFHNSCLNISKYTGVDPYSGEAGDSYTGVYWQDRRQADTVFHETAEKYERWGYTLLRTSSLDFLNALPDDAYFDLIYVDGDHRFLPALLDMCAALPYVANGGLLAVDDYANVDTPEVTRAFNRFCELHVDNILRMGYVENSFRNAGKHVPIVQRTVFLQPVEISRRVAVRIPESESEPRVAKHGRYSSSLLTRAMNFFSK